MSTQPARKRFLKTTAVGGVALFLVTAVFAADKSGILFPIGPPTKAILQPRRHKAKAVRETAVECQSVKPITVNSLVPGKPSPWWVKSLTCRATCKR